jgi:DNA (cytosine-5)-methyltransferase 1
MAYVAEHVHEYDAIHASPPCQLFPRLGHLRDAQGRENKHADLVAPTRAALEATGLPYVIENVPGAPLIDPVLLCGSSFGLRVRRHRLFESNVFLLRMPCRHDAQPDVVGVYHRTGERIPHGGRTARNVAEGREAMGIDWMTWRELTQAIPPVFTYVIGTQLRRYLEAA